MLFVLCASRVSAEDWALSLRMDKDDPTKQAPALWQGDPVTFYVVAMGSTNANLKLLLPETTDFKLSLDRAVLLHEGDRQGLAFPVHLLPMKSGQIELPPLTLTDGQKSQKTQPIPLTIKAPLTSDRMTLTTELSRDEIYLGQSIRLTTRWIFDLSLESLKAVHLLQPELVHPDIKFFQPWDGIDTSSLQSIGLPVSGQRLIAGWRNLEQHAVEIQLTQVIQPQKAGDYHFPAASLLVNVDKTALQERGQRYRGSTMPSYFNNSFFETFDQPERYERYRVSSEPKRILVKALPEPIPAHFSGLVGKPFLKASVSPVVIQEGQPIQYSLELQHPDIESIRLGSLRLQPEFLNGFDIPSDPVPAQQEGSAQWFHQSIFPKSAEIKEVPAYYLSYFDPVLKTYQELALPAIPIEVTARPSFDLNDAQLSEKVKLVNAVKPYEKGIWGHKWGNELTQAALVETMNPLCWLLLLLPPVGFGVLLVRLWLQQKRGRQQETPFGRFKKNVLADGEGIRHLTRYCQERLDLAPSQCNPNTLAKRLACFDLSLANDISAWLADAEQGYATSADHSAKLSTQETHTILGLIAQLESRLNQPAKKTGLAGRTIAVIAVLVMCQALPSDAYANNIQTQLETLYQEHQKALTLAEGFSPQAKRVHESVAQQLTLLLANEDLNKASLMYNIGSSWYHAGRYGYAILWLQRAALLTPDDEEIQHNLAQARAERLDALPRYFAPTWYSLLYQAVSSSAWAWYCLVIYLWLCLATYQQLKSKLTPTESVAQAQKGYGIALLSAALLLALLGLAVAHWLPPQHSDGVITARAVKTKKGPHAIFAAATKTELHQGTEFILLQQQEGWVKVKLSNEQTVWLPSESVDLFVIPISHTR